ncbi:MAG: cytochrome c [Chloroflexi bacterium]|nr:cytochrome c [Chloroflexota bacterium]
MRTGPLAFALATIGVLLASCSGLGGEPAIIVTLPPRVTSESAQSAAGDWQPNLTNGGRIFAERCVECHGLSGDGRGELVIAGSVEPPLDMTDRAQVMAKSPLEWFDIITKGNIAKLMPPWEDALTEAERWDVALYSYTLAYDDALLASGERIWRESCGECALPTVIPPVFSDVEYAARLNRDLFGSALTAAEAAAATAYARWTSLSAVAQTKARLSLGEITGRVLQGTAGGRLPADTVVQLHYGNSDVGFSVAETIAEADGGFLFEGIPLSADLDYAVGAEYAGRLFSQRVFPLEEAEQTITIYDATNDPLAVSVARISLSLEPATLEGLGAGLYISQILTYRNDSDRIYLSGRGFEDGREATLLIQFPQGARLLSGDANGRYVVIEDVQGLPDSAIDTLPVLPGEAHDLLLEFWLPYQDGARYEQKFNNRIDAEVTITAAEELRLESEWLGQGAANESGAYRSYSAALRLNRDPRISFEISGQPFATSSDERFVVTSEALSVVLLGAFALAGALLGGLGLMKRRQDRSGSEIDRLVAELARLEADHDQGQINHDLYHHRRRELKAKLAQLMERADE